MDALSRHACAAYRALVYETPGFLGLLPRLDADRRDRGAQPRKPPGVAQSVRSASRTCAPFPWVFSWSQCRVSLPGWYGFGSAVEAWLDEAPASAKAAWRCYATCTHAGRSSRSMLSNMSMVLAKTDFAIAARYADLVPDRALREAIFPRLAAEHERSMRWLLAISGKTELAGGQPDARAQHSEPVCISRSIEPPADRAAASLPLGRDGRADEASDTPHDKRAGGRAQK